MQVTIRYKDGKPDMLAIKAGRARLCLQAREVAGALAVLLAEKKRRAARSTDLAVECREGHLECHVDALFYRAHQMPQKQPFMDSENSPSHK